jgi:enterochelin esterase-like enzyme
MKIRSLLALLWLVIGFTLPTFAQQKESTPGESTPAATPTPTLGEHDTQVLPDRRVTFRLLAPKANAVKVMIGVKSGVYEPQGTTVTDMTKQFEIQLRASNIKHVYTVMPGTHSMFVFRPALANFLQEVFKK